MNMYYDIYNDIYIMTYIIKHIKPKASGKGEIFAELELKLHFNIK